MRADASGDPPFTELLARVAEASTGAYAHQDLPFARMVETLRVDRDPSRAPVFQIALTYAERDDVPATAGGVEFLLADPVVGIKRVEVRPGHPWRRPAPRGCGWSARMRRRCSTRVRCERLLGHLEVLLRGGGG